MAGRISLSAVLTWMTSSTCFQCLAEAPVTPNGAFRLLIWTETRFMTSLHGKNLPVAESYYQLQSISEIEALFSLSEEQSNTAAQTLCLLRSSFDLLFINVRDIVCRNLETLDNQGRGREYQIAKRQIWVRELFEIGLRLSEETRAQTYDAAQSNASSSVPSLPSKAFVEMQQAIELYCERIIQLFGAEQIKQGLDYQSQFDAHSNMFHMLKVNYHNLRCIRANLISSITPKSFATNKCLDLARETARYPEQIKDTFLQQFCLLHQIPELLGRMAVKLIREAIAYGSKNPGSSISAFARAERLVVVCQQCLRPLTNELLPYEYSRIRHYLGVTSGSHSSILSKQLLGKVLDDLAEYRRMLESESESASPQRKRLCTATFRLFDRLQGWRDLHMHLPRNVLGIGGVRSLIDSPDAVERVKSMSRVHGAVSQKHEVRLQKGPAFEQTDDKSLDRLDAILLQMTGEQTKARFKAVQERTGIYSAKPKILGGDSETPG